MPDTDRRQIHFPGTLSELLHLTKRLPGAQLYAGGTYIRKIHYSRFGQLPAQVISLQDVEELQRISRSERYLEIGAAVPVGTVLRIASNILPQVLSDALESVGPPGIASLATIGGNLCVPEHILTTAPVLNALDTRVELRRQGNTRWLPVSRLRDSQGKLALNPGEVVTRIRLPMENWNVQVFRKFGKLYHADTHPLVFCGLARSGKSILEDFRVVIAGHGPALFRNRELEADLVGRRIPMAEREAQLFLKRVDVTMAQLKLGFSDLQSHRARALIRGFVRTLGH